MSTEFEILASFPDFEISTSIPVKFRKRGKLRNLKITQDGNYNRVCLSKEGSKPKAYKVHKILATHFHDYQPGDMIECVDNNFLTLDTTDIIVTKKNGPMPRKTVNTVFTSGKKTKIEFQLTAFIDENTLEIKIETVKIKNINENMLEE